MDGLSRLSVTTLIHRRSAGQISSAEFFECLSGIGLDGDQDSGEPAVFARSDVGRDPVSSKDAGKGIPALLTTQEATALAQQLRTSQSSTSYAAAAGVAAGAMPPTSLAFPSPLPKDGGALPARGCQAAHWPLCAEDLRSSPRCVESSASSNLSSCEEKHGDVLCSEILGLSSLSPWQAWSPPPLSGCSPCIEGLADAEVHATAAEPLNLQRSFASTSCSSSFSEFAKRNDVWEVRRAQRRDQLRRDLDAKEIAECSFHPSLSASASCGATGFGPADDAQRCALSKAKAAQRKKLAAKMQAEREQDVDRECTFTPDVSQSASSFQSCLRSTSSSVSDIASTNISEEASNARIASRSAREVAYGPRGVDRDEAFVPHTNAIAPNMVCAQSYVRQNVFKRLSQPQGDLHQQLHEPHDVALEPVECDHSAADHGTHGGRGNELACGLVEPLLPVALFPSDVGQTDMSILTFLQRQNEYEDERRQRLYDVEKHLAPTLRPKLCARSRKLAERRRTLSRNRNAISRRDANASRTPQGNSEAGVDKQGKDRTKSVDMECSFRPEINPSSARRSARSCTDLSTGDHARREHHIAELREQRQMELEEQTRIALSPVKSSTLANVSSQLRLLEEPDSYLQRIQEADDARSARRNLALDRAAANELDECTFRPKAHNPVPSFVRHMAQSHRAAKAMQKAVEGDRMELGASQRPDWR